MAEGGYSLADISAAMGGAGGFGGNGGIAWIAILFLFVLMGGGGFGMNGARAATQDMVQGSFNYSNLLDQNRDILNAVSSGTAQAVAATNQAKYDNINVAKDIQMALASELNRLETQGANILANQNQCCCNTLRAIDSVNFNASQNTAAINANTTAQTQKILDALSQNKIDALQGQVQQLQLQQAVAGVVRYPTSATFNIPVPNVFGPPVF